MNNMEMFNDLVGQVFGKLYENFPTPLELESGDFLENFVSMDGYDETWDFDDFFDNTVTWLEESGYVRISDDTQEYGGSSAFVLVLSEKGLETLRKSPQSLEGSASLGERFVEFSKTRASDAIGTLVSLAVTSAINT